MNGAEIFEKIKSILQQKNQLDIIREIESRISIGTTGGEITAMVGKYLFDLEKYNPQVFEIIKPEVMNYVEYCKRVGIYIE